jgi:hypothetical protein
MVRRLNAGARANLPVLGINHAATAWEIGFSKEAPAENISGRISLKSASRRFYV